MRTIHGVDDTICELCIDPAEAAIATSAVRNGTLEAMLTTASRVAPTSP
jgi:hypothetical protein